MDRVKSSMQQVPNAIPKVIRRTGGANSLELEKENFERGQVRIRGHHVGGSTLFFFYRKRGMKVLAGSRFVGWEGKRHVSCVLLAHKLNCISPEVTTGTRDP